MANTIYEWYQSLNDHAITVISGAADLDRPFHGFQIAERPESVSNEDKDKLIFTTGVAERNEDDLTSLIRKAVFCNTAGIIIQTGLYIKSIPESAMTVLKHNNFPSFSVSRSAHLEDLMQAAASLDNIEAMKYARISSLITHEDLSTEETALMVQYGFSPHTDYMTAIIASPITRELKGFHNLIKYGDELVAIFPAESFADSFKEIRDTCEKTGINYCIGPSMTGITGICRSIYMADHMMQENKILHLLQHTHDAFGIELAQMQSFVKQSDLYEKAVKIYYEPVVKYDRENSSDLVEFIKCYLKMNGNTGQIADTLKIHRNTVLYKVHKFESLISTRLTNYEVIFWLTLIYL